MFPSRLGPVRIRPAYALVMLACPPCTAEPLAVEGVPDSIPAGQGFTFRVKAQEPGIPEANVLLSQGGAPYLDRRIRLDLPDGTPFTIPAPPPSWAALTVELALPSGFRFRKEVRILPQPAPAAGMPRALPPPRPPSLAGMSGDILAEIAGFADHTAALAPVSRNLAAAVRAGEVQARILDAIDDPELARRLAPLRRLTGLEILNPGTLTSAGVRRAVEAAPFLRRLVVAGRVLTRKDALAILDLRKGLTAFRVPGLRLCTLDLAALPPALRELHLESVEIPDAALAGLKALESLELARCRAFQGQELPPSLRILKVWDCPDFAPRTLPSGLEELLVQGAPGFAGGFELPRLRSLELVGCKVTASPLLPATLAAARNLKVLSADFEVGRAALAHLAPTLTSLCIRCSQLRDGDLAHLTGLQDLALGRCGPMTGQGLPTGLRTLRLVRCPEVRTCNLAPLTQLVSLDLTDCASAFDGKGLPASLERLHVLRCDRFALRGLPGNLTELFLSGGTIDAIQVEDAVGALPRLATLSCDEQHFGVTSFPDLLGHPVLKAVHIQYRDRLVTIPLKDLRGEQSSRTCAIL